ncbi:MAG: ornithine aminotransferase, mitochondrial [Rickettsiaceae bacterium]|jgi:ornithine--oxo-acid transaminase|nr:ornithine aminotransferase, mitochondrial [Rickettsiaceae bacterium]
MAKLHAESLLDKSSSFTNRTEYLKHLYHKYVANHYHPMEGIVLQQADGYFVKAVDGRVFTDFFASYAVVNAGHRCPEIAIAAFSQMLKLHSTGGAYNNEPYCELAKVVHDAFGYDKMLPCNGGAEAVEGAIKIATRWWHDNKKGKGELDDKDTAIIVGTNGAYHGQSGGVWSFRDSEEETRGFDPAPRNRRKVPFGDADALEELFKKEGQNIAAFLVEPIQGEGGVIVPPKGYLRRVRELCTKYNVKWIGDEIQAGLGRTGKMLAQEHEGVRADIVLLGKGLAGGLLPVSLILADEETMSVLGPGDHGSTFGGNPAGSAIAIATLKILKELCALSEKTGAYALDKVHEKLDKYTKGDNPIIKDIRGKGLFIGLEFTNSAIGIRDVLIRHGILCKQTKENTLRITPPLTMPENIIDLFVDMVAEICEAKAQGKNLKDLQITPMIDRLAGIGIKPEFNYGSKILSEVLSGNIAKAETAKELDSIDEQIVKLQQKSLARRKELGLEKEPRTFVEMTGKTANQNRFVALVTSNTEREHQ